MDGVIPLFPLYVFMEWGRSYFDLHIFKQVLQETNIAVGIVTSLWAGRTRNSGSAPGKSKRISSSPKRLDGLCGPHNLVLNEGEIFLGE